MANLTVKEIAVDSRRHPSSVRRWIYSEALKASLVGGRILVSEKDYLAFIRKPGDLRKKHSREGGDA